MERAARADLNMLPDDDPVPRYEWHGFHLPIPPAEIWNLWFERKMHGTLMVQGGYMDQPSSYWLDMHGLDAMYNVLAIQLLREKRKKSLDSDEDDDA